MSSQSGHSPVLQVFIKFSHLFFINFTPQFFRFFRNFTHMFLITLLGEMLTNVIIQEQQQPRKGAQVSQASTSSAGKKVGKALDRQLRFDEKEGKSNLCTFWDEKQQEERRGLKGSLNEEGAVQHS